MKTTCKNLNDLRKTAEKLLDVFVSQKGSGALVVGLCGDLGSGKTAFTKELAGVLGIKEMVTSPTFVIEKIYRLKSGAPFKQLIHIDAYRLEGARDIEVLGWGEVLENSENLVLIEWPEMVQGALPKNTIFIDFTFIDEKTRKITW